MKVRLRLGDEGLGMVWRRKDEKESSAKCLSVCGYRARGVMPRAGSASAANNHTETTGEWGWYLAGRYCRAAGAGMHGRFQDAAGDGEALVEDSRLHRSQHRGIAASHHRDLPACPIKKRAEAAWEGSRAQTGHSTLVTHTQTCGCQDGARTRAGGRACDHFCS